MAKELANLLVRVGADISAFEKQMNKAARMAEGWGRTMTSAGQTMTTGITLPLAAAGGAAIKMAMDAVESENLFTVSMGKMADEARAWSEDLQKSLNLNGFEVRKQVGTFYNMFDSMKMGETAAYSLATGLTKLAYDMSSFYNLPTEDAFEKLSSGITGEIEPLKRLGILVNEETVKQYAYANGIAKTGATLNEQQKVMARYVAIMDQTKNAQGDLARTADSETNQLRAMQREVALTATEFGTALLPMVREAIALGRPLVAQLKEGVAWFTNLDTSTKRQIVTYGLLVAAAGPVVWALGSIATGIANMIRLIPLAIGGVGRLAKYLGTLPAVAAWFREAQISFTLARAGAVSWGQALVGLAGGPVGVAIIAVGALAVAIGAVVWAKKKAREEAYKQSKSLVELSAEYNRLTNTLATVERTSLEYSMAAEDQKRVISEVGEMFPNLVKRWDDHGKAIALHTSLLEKDTKAARDNVRAWVEQDYNKLMRQVQTLRGEKTRLESELAIAAQAQEMPHWMQGLFAAGSGDGMPSFGQTSPFVKSTKDVQDEISAVQGDIDKLLTEMGKMYAQMYPTPNMEETVFGGINSGAANASESIDDLIAKWKDLTGEVTGSKGVNGKLWGIADAGLVAARQFLERAKATANVVGQQAALSIISAANSMGYTPAMAGAAGGVGAIPLQVGGTVEVVVKDTKGNTIGSTEVLADELFKNQDRYPRKASVRGW